jgi:hypothetical protein
MMNEVADFREPRPGDLRAVQPAYCFLAIHGRKYGLDLGIEGASVGDSPGVGRESLVGKRSSAAGPRWRTDAIRSAAELRQ